MNIKKRSRIQWFILVLGWAGTIFYFLHVIIGTVNYPGYNPLTQAVSDLTAATAPSREAASAFAQVSGVCVVALCVLLCIFYERKVNQPFRLGIYLFTAMEGLSSVGYTLFPLSDSGYAGAFQDIMHVVVTVFVVVLSIAAMVLITVGCFKHNTYRSFGVITFAALGSMLAGAAGIGLFPAFLGVSERFSVYSVILYCAALTVLSFHISPNSPTDQ